MPRPLLSVCVITFNQEKFIRETVLSIINQNCSFHYEILIFDDNSNDNTDQICEELQFQFQSKIKYKKNSVNLGMTGNWALGIRSCNGKYIALCEGDDYWIDPNKLEKQIQFLEGNLNYSICFHNVLLKDGDNQFTGKFSEIQNEKSFTISDLSRGNFLSTPSVVYRNNCFDKLPEWFSESPVCDYVIHMLNARKGKIKYFPECMAVYRRHGGGVWSTLKYKENVEKWIKVLNLLLTEDFEPEVISLLKEQRRTQAVEYCKALLSDGDDGYLEMMRNIIDDDPLFAQQWLLEYYPKFINEIRGSKSYRLAKRFSFFKKLVFKN